MKKIQILKRSFYLLLGIVTFLPVINLSARGGSGEGRNMGSERNMGTQRNPNAEHKYQSPGDKAVESNRIHQNRYNENAGYGSGSGDVVVPTSPGSGSQPGMSDDSDALYNSYMQSNTPQ